MPSASLRASLLAALVTLNAACRTGGGADESEALITNGIQVPASFMPAVIDLDLRLPTGDTANCSGFFTDEVTVVTAGHCVFDLEPVDVRIAGVKAARLTLHPEYPRDPGADRDAPFATARDVAVVTFPPGTAAAVGVDKFLTLATTPPRVGQDVRLVGFGCNRVFANKRCTGDGVKRAGDNKITLTDGLVIELEGVMSGPLNGTAVDSASAPGDSGGPMLDGSDLVLGLVSRGIPAPAGRKGSRYVDIQSVHAKRVLADAKSADATSSRSGGVEVFRLSDATSFDLFQSLMVRTRPVGAIDVKTYLGPLRIRCALACVFDAPKPGEAAAVPLASLAGAAAKEVGNVFRRDDGAFDSFDASLVCEDDPRNDRFVCILRAFD
jgi:hypothetical protein